MGTAINVKRKNIDIPVDTLQKLSLMAVVQGKSLKTYIESILISKADAITVEISESPSPSKDEWFENRQNMNDLEQSIQQQKDGKVKAYSMDEIRKVLGA